MLWMGTPEVHVAYGISPTALPLYRLRTVPRRAIARLRMTSRTIYLRYFPATWLTHFSPGMSKKGLAGPATCN
jgi:hypothetical protein